MTSDEILKTEPLVTTYLQMLSHLELRNAKSGLRIEKFDVHELKKSDWKFNRDMYFQVGEKWKWIDKRPWTDEQWKEYAIDPDLRTFAGYCGNDLAGYYELKRSAAELQARTPAATGHMSHVAGPTNDEIEIAYFGLLPEFIGRGLGAELLSSAIETAWSWSPTPSRVWVHTCNRDHSSALANYQARGFKVYKTVTCDM